MTRPQDVQATFAATLVDEWVRGGVAHAVLCPGSRSTPMALAVADHRGLAVHVHHDERSAGFLALGIGLATGRPALVVVTSGTAAAELHPAIVEAHQAGVPLLACTTDRPPELRDVGAPQTIDQIGLYGRAVRWFADPGVPDAAGAGRWRAFAARALAEATGDDPGPVQLNLPFREPLVGAAGPLPVPRAEVGAGQPSAHSETAGAGHLPPPLRVPRADVAAGRSIAHAEAAGAGPWTGLAPSRVDVGVDVRALAGSRGVIVAGAWRAAADGASAGTDADGGGVAVHRVAEALGWPVLADPRSPAWRPAPTLVPHLDALLRSHRAAADLQPEVIVRLGPPAASRVVGEWLAGSGAEEIVVAGRSWSDPAGTAAMVSRADPAAAVATWSAALDSSPALPRPPEGWLPAWQAAATAAATTLDHLLAPPGGPAPARQPAPPHPGAAVEPGGRVGGVAVESGSGAAVPPGGPASGVAAEAGMSEPGVAREVIRGVPEGGWVVVSSSMPVRDVERYAVPRAGVRVVANRGANGIDGVVSTAVGVAAGTGKPTALLIGDIAFLHDSNGLLGAAARQLDLVCVVVDNDGGGIFSFLPQATSVPTERFERLFGTPHGLDLVAVARALGTEARAVDADVAGEMAAAFDKGGVHVLVVRTDRDANVDVHRRLDDAVAAAVDAALAEG